jgi:RimJ/RimL family protein N-acetyltransferase
MQDKNKIILRPYLDSDIHFLKCLRNDVELQKLLLSTARGSDENAVRQWLSPHLSGVSAYFRVIFDVERDYPVGYIQADKFYGSASAYTFGICIAPPFQSSRIGSTAILLMELDLQRLYGVSKLILYVDSENMRAIGCYKRLYYREVGIFMSHLKVCGELKDVLIMEKLLNNFSTDLKL